MNNTRANETLAAENDVTASGDGVITRTCHQERTCKNTLPYDWGTFECDQCGRQYSVVPVYITAGGTPNDDPDPSSVNYCPNCGAKVVGE